MVFDNSTLSELIGGTARLCAGIIATARSCSAAHPALKMSAVRFGAAAVSFEAQGVLAIGKGERRKKSRKMSAVAVAP